MKSSFTCFVTLALLASVTSGPLPAFADAPAFLGAWGSSGSGTGQFLGPIDVAVDASGDVYVTDTGNNRIQKFTSEGVFLLAWGGRGSEPGQMASPFRLAWCPDGNLMLSDVDNFRIQKFTPTGQWLRTYGEHGLPDAPPGQFPSLPMGIAVSAEDVLFVGPYLGQSVDKFHPDGTVERLRPIPADAPWGVYCGYDLAVDSQGNFYVPDMNRIDVFTNSGTWIHTIREPNWCITVSPNEHLYVANQGHFAEYTLAGQLVNAWDSPPLGPGAFTQVAGICVDAASNIYLLDGSRVLKFGPGPVPVVRTSWGRIKTHGSH